MANICFYFQLHQPLRIRPYSVFEIGKHTPYFDQAENRRILEQVSRNCYEPGLKLIQEIIAQPDFRGAFTFSLSGTVIEQLEAWRPNVIEQLKKLTRTGHIEFLAETYYHSLAFEYSRKEFERQIDMHAEKIENLFGKRPKVFRNTGLLFHNPMAFYLQNRGYLAQVVEGSDYLLKGNNPNQLYHATHLPKFPLIVRNFGLSDDIALRFSDPNWERFPLSAPDFANQMEAQGGETICIAFDFESLGEYHSADTGIFDFFKELPPELVRRGHRLFSFSELISSKSPVASLDAQYPVSWTDPEKNISAWKGNSRQNEALRKIYELESVVKEKSDPSILQSWSYLQVSDHFYYMTNKHRTDPSDPQGANPFETPESAYIHYMNLLADFQISLNK